MCLSYSLSQALAGCFLPQESQAWRNMQADLKELGPVSANGQGMCAMRSIRQATVPPATGHCPI